MQPADGGDELVEIEGRRHSLLRADVVDHLLIVDLCEELHTGEPKGDQVLLDLCTVDRPARSRRRVRRTRAVRRLRGGGGGRRRSPTTCRDDEDDDDESERSAHSATIDAVTGCPRK